MSNQIASCELLCLQKTHDAIQLPDGETVAIGRSPQTQIKDPRCSRNQIELVADWTNRTVRVFQNGPNPSAIDGADIEQNCEATMGASSTLFILSHMYPHKVVFTPALKSNTDNKQGNNPHITKSEKEKSDKKKSVSTVQSSSSADKRAKEQVNRKDADIEMKDSKTKSSSKRSSVDSDEQQPAKKKMKTDEESKGIDNRNGASGKSELKVQASSKHPKAETDKKINNSSKSKIADSDCGRSSNGNNAVESDDDSHMALIESKLNKLKHNANEQTRLQDKTPKGAERLSAFVSPSAAQPSSSTTRAPSELQNSFKKTPLSSSSGVKNYPLWDHNVDHCVFTSKGVVASNKIAGFDLDGTIIKTRSNKAFPEDANDWKVYIPEIFNKLKDLHAKKFKIVFFTNQLGVARGKLKIEDLIMKVPNIVAKLQVPVQVFISTHEGRYRKPMTGMWEKLLREFNDGMSIDLESSIFVGDAAGRQANWAPKKKKDHSCSDRLFALNIGVAFKTPEEFFLNQKPTSLFKMPEFDPRRISSDEKLLSSNNRLTSDSKEVIVLVGFPASGKSHFAASVLAPKRYKIISRDILGTWQKCVKQAQEALVNSSIVIDNTNLSKEERARYIDCAKKALVPCRCFVFTTTVEHCRHNERFRQMTTKSHTKINDLIFNQIKKKFEEPNMNEGFIEIVNVNFVPRFSSKKDEADYRKFLLEK